MLIETLWRSSPQEVVRKSRRRVRSFLAANKGWDYSLDAVLANEKALNPRFEIERWERNWRAAGIHGSGGLRSRFETDGKTVFELGCGPVLGYGPVALFLGATNFRYTEPDLQRTVLESKILKERYFRALYEELIANYGKGTSFSDWYTKTLECSGPLEQSAEATIDISISQSVLEHIPRNTLGPLLEGMQRAHKPDSWFLHLVDYGPHGGGFQSLYSLDRAVESRRLNLLRNSEVEELFARHNMRIRRRVPYKRTPVKIDLIHESWRSYSMDDLETRVMILIGDSLPL